MGRFALICGIAVVFGGATFPGQAQGWLSVSPQTNSADTIGIAESHFRKGEEAYLAGQYDQARREFDEAVDSILVSEVDVRHSEELKIYYRTLIEKINRYQIAAIEQKDGGFSEQRHEPSPLDKIASLSDAELEEVTGDDEVGRARLNFQFTTAPA